MLIIPGIQIYVIVFAYLTLFYWNIHIKFAMVLYCIYNTIKVTIKKRRGRWQPGMKWQFSFSQQVLPPVAGLGVWQSGGRLQLAKVEFIREVWSTATMKYSLFFFGNFILLLFVRRSRSEMLSDFEACIDAGECFRCDRNMQHKPLPLKQLTLCIIIYYFQRSLVWDI